MTPYNCVRFGLLVKSIVDANALLRHIWHCIGIPISALLARTQIRCNFRLAPVMLEAEADKKPRRGPKAAGE